MEKKSGWDDVPSLDGLSVDWDYTPENECERRSFRRLNNKDMFKLFDAREIVVKLATTQHTYDGQLIDISDGGLGLNLPVLLKENELVKVGLLLGPRKIVTKGLVKHASKSETLCKTGIKFVDLAKDASEYISGLYASRILLRSH